MLAAEDYAFENFNANGLITHGLHGWGHSEAVIRITVPQSSKTATNQIRNQRMLKCFECQYSELFVF